MKRRDSSDDLSIRGSGAAAERPALLALPPDLLRRLLEFLDGGGSGGTTALYALSCAHRSLASCAGMATRLDVSRPSVHCQDESFFEDGLYTYILTPPQCDIRMCAWRGRRPSSQPLSGTGCAVATKSVPSQSH